MPPENAISIEIPAEEVTKVQDALQIITDTLKPYLIALTPSDRQELPKMSDKTTPFVEKVLNYAESDSQFSPAYMDLPELKKDVEAVSTLTRVFRVVAQLNENLNDTITLAGSEAFIATLAYYNSVKHAARMNVPGAKTIYDDLKKRFAK